MGYKWHSAGIKGVRYREHPTRKHGVRKDRYYAIRYQKDGKRVEEGLGWASDEGFDLDKALEELSALRKAARIGEGPTRLKEKRDIAIEKKKAEKRAREAEEALNVTFKSYAEGQYFPTAEPGWKPETARKHKEHCKIWLYPHIGNMSLRQIRVTHVNQIKAAMMKKGRSPRTMQAVFRSFSMIWTSARDAEIVSAKSPTNKASFKLPKIDNERMRFLTAEESENLLYCVRARNEQAAEMAVVSLESGLRFGEVAALNWSCVDMANRSLQVLNTKGKRDRIVPMTSKLHKLFAKMEVGKPNTIVFPNKFGLEHLQVPSQFKRGVVDSKLNEDIDDRKMKVSFHSLRHTYASRMVQNGVDLYRLQRLLGHRTPTLTARYAKLADDDLKKAVEQMEKREKAKAQEQTGKIIPIAANDK